MNISNYSSSYDIVIFHLLRWDIACSYRIGKNLKCTADLLRNRMHSHCKNLLKEIRIKIEAVI